MKRLIKTVTITLALGASILSATATNNYAITENYKLLNDMNLVKKQQYLVLNMAKALKTNHVDMKASKRFNKVLLGLINGSNSLKLKGTNIPEIKTKLNEIEELWKNQLSTLSTAKSDKDTKKAIEILDNIIMKINEVVFLYNKSYDRFKQKVKLSSIVGDHTVINNMQLFAFNGR